MMNFRIAFIGRALIIGTAIIRIAIVSEFSGESYIDIKKTITEILHKIIKQEYTKKIRIMLKSSCYVTT